MCHHGTSHRFQGHGCGGFLSGSVEVSANILRCHILLQTCEGGAGGVKMSDRQAVKEAGLLRLASLGTAGATATA